MKRTSNRNAAIEYLKREHIYYEYDKDKDSLYFLKFITKDEKVSVFFNIDLTDDGYIVTALPNTGELLEGGTINFDFPLTPAQINIMGELTRFFLYINSSVKFKAIDFDPSEGSIIYQIEIGCCSSPAEARKKLSHAVDTGMAIFCGFCEEITDILYNGRDASYIFPELKSHN